MVEKTEFCMVLALAIAMPLISAYFLLDVYGSRGVGVLAAVIMYWIMVNSVVDVLESGRARSNLMFAALFATTSITVWEAESYLLVAGLSCVLAWVCLLIWFETSDVIHGAGAGKQAVTGGGR